jgi:prolyl-tRNA editing enzyme YbaK/EbsC (Cys-tRNA(Pro) deacylase)
LTQTQTLTKSAQSVQDVLNSKGLECAVVVLSESTRTAVDAAINIGCDVAQIVKSLIFKTKSTEQAVLVLASGPNRVNEKTIEAILGEKITKADAVFTRDITGFAIGGIPPIGHKQKIEHIFIDEDLLTFDKVWAAAGTPNAVFHMTSKDLLEMTDGKVVSIK